MRVLTLAVLAALLASSPRALRSQEGAESSRASVGLLRARSLYDAGEFEGAARLFAELAAGIEGEARSVMQVRAADAFERAGYREAAAELYRAARTTLTEISGWLALREARASTDRDRARELLQAAEGPRQRLAREIRAALLIASGDTVGAVGQMALAGHLAEAARLSLAGRDTAHARELAYRALIEGDTAEVREAIDLAQRVLGPGSAREFRALALAHRRLDLIGEAASLIREGVARGDSSAGTFVLLARLELERGRSSDAVQAFRSAARGKGPAAVVAAYEYARLLGRLQGREAGRRALLEFADRYPAHRLAPLAAYLAAEVSLEERDPSRAESLLAAIERRWPRSLYASRSRLRLASLALERGDTVSALTWYGVEIKAGGDLLNAALFASGRVEWELGDTVGARKRWIGLARRDSLGYYGALGRDAAGLGDPVMADSPLPRPTRRLARALQELDRLLEFGWMDEARDLVLFWMEREDLATDEQLALGDGLIERGFASQGVALGWRASRALTLNDSRVLRVVFPWPYRQLILDEAREHGVDPYLVAALIRQESVFRPDVTSRAGARGLMQLMPPTAREVARRLGMDWHDRMLAAPQENLHVGLAHLTGLLERYEGDVALALAAYNAGASPVQRWRHAWDGGDVFFFVEGIPYRETRSYVRSVLRNRALYRALYPGALSREGEPR